VVYDWNVSIVVISLLFACFLPLYLLSDASKKHDIENWSSRALQWAQRYDGMEDQYDGV